MSAGPDRVALPYRPGLDGLRAVAVYLVVVFHAGVGALEGGFVGVDLFFVLSGFLVSGVILNEVDQRGTFSLGGFYARRVRRLLPAALLVIVATAALQLLLSSVAVRVDLVGDARGALLYVANWQFLAESGDYFALDDSPSPFLHFWSLSIEEQFYVAFPVLVLLALRLSRRPVRLLAAVIGAVALVSVALQVWRAAGDASYAYYATETRVYQLAAGVALMLLARGAAARPVGAALSRASTPAAALGLVLLLVVASAAVDVSPSSRGLLATVAAVLVVGGVWWGPRGLVSRALSLPLPRYLGQVSYSTYLWHWPVLLVLGQVLAAGPLVTALLGATVATALAALSERVLETPVRRSAVLDRFRWPVVTAGLALSVVAALVVVPTVLESEQRPVVAAGSSEGPTGLAALDRPVPDVDLVAAKADIGEQTPAMCTVDDPDACTQVRGDGLHVLLLGDSQAIMFTPLLEALAHDHDLTVSTNVQNGCPWQAGQVNSRGEPGADVTQACLDARGPFLAGVLPLMDVDVVLAIGLSRSDTYWETRLTGVDAPPGETLHELQLRTTRETAAAITAAGSRLVISHSIFGTQGYGLRGFDPIECLAAAASLGDCAVTPPVQRPSVDDVYGVLAIEEPDIATIDLTGVVCPDRPLCLPVIGRHVIWKDRDHVTASWLVERREAIWRRLVATGLL